MNEIEKVVREELGKLVNADVMSIPEDSEISEYAEFDSLSALELFGMIEEKFKILIPPEKIPEMRTIKAIVEVIEENTQS